MSGIEKNKFVLGAGVSCGVDSLFTIKRRLIDSASNYERYLLLNNMTDDDGERDNRFNAICQTAKRFSKESNIDLIVADSNYTSGKIPGLCAEGSTTFCCLFFALSLQNLFSRYYIASGGPVADFGHYLKNGLFGTGCSDYDLLTFSACSTSSLKFIVDGLEDRIKKVATLVDWSLAWDHLDVCYRHTGGGGNGTYDCPKCMRTIADILCVGGMPKLQKFSGVFDVKYVEQHMCEYLADLIRLRLHGSEFGRELWPMRKNAGFTSMDYVNAFIIVVRKIFR